MPDRASPRQMISDPGPELGLRHSKRHWRPVQIVLEWGAAETRAATRGLPGPARTVINSSADALTSTDARLAERSS
jgi:hypothetical protein